MKPLEIEIFDRQYTFNLPNVGQRMEIESRKILYSGGIYADLAKSDHLEARKLLNVIDAVSIFGVLNKELDLPFENFKSLTHEHEFELAAAFLKYYKWEQEQEAEINKLFEEKVKAKNATAATTA